MKDAYDIYDALKDDFENLACEFDTAMGRLIHSCQAYAVLYEDGNERDSLTAARYMALEYKKVSDIAERLHQNFYITAEEILKAVEEIEGDAG